ncbi:hypothetical protein [Thermocladium modestius]|uniref:hypothetical protein n=1 Tax=Thermocladium modestius TaxID=62609 RepID=UPI00166BDBBC|nr:hypothetical protein [Thermocladium modestius]
MSRIIFSYYYGLKFSIRHPLTLLSLYFDSLAILFILSVIEGKLNDIALMGSIASTLTLSGFSSAGDFSYLTRVVKFTDMIWFDEAARRNYTVSIYLVNLLFPLPLVLVYVLLLLLTVKLPLTTLLTMFVEIFMLYLTSSNLGLFMALKISWAYRAREVFFIIASVITLLPPVYYNVKLLPHYMVFVSMLLPTSAITVFYQIGTSIVLELSLVSELTWLILSLLIALKYIKYIY